MITEEDFRALAARVLTLETQGAGELTDLESAVADLRAKVAALSEHLQAAPDQLKPLVQHLQQTPDASEEHN